MPDFKPKIFQQGDRQAVVFHGLCKGCGLCILRCPKKAISFSKDDVGIYHTPTVVINLQKCQQCGLCEIICPDSAILIKK
ncbi:4Fe-4S ferredoxin [Candidatus Shapirobacteria bacterium CG09_land_8_20_14_0_10_49_15]|uniref:4Fe-4S ferredoxin n=2 Tax=Candidatus Shapironibacteriota TaxID=1752721 RepID=A0A2M8L747_9BACT|nr:MAG: 4Fe-4S ferredoxin [Candidatus Shapirobacteria bacterium CG09_land_8_20_14_0_10_49_15]PJE70066.1 MAG: 4Fe-4S ferredoxin [Candidatus Shapirobacteria bacterium CG10_big_fil_rev_8_21_14_0_10_48_15]